MSLHQAFYYYLYFICLFASLFLFALLATGSINLYWQIFYKVYLFLTVLHTWYIFTLLAIGDFKKSQFLPYRHQKITCIIPCYNEDPQLLDQCLQSVLHARGNKHIVLINDGSTNDILPVLEKYTQLPNFTIHHLTHNLGKRHAVHLGVTQYLHQAEYVVLMDSDTIIKPDTLINLIKPLQNPRVGATSGDVKLINESANFLTRMISTYYWTALHIHRKAQSTLGMVSCCSGAIAGYKSKLISSFINDFISQKFFDELCTYSDDRHLTNLVLKSGHDVIFVPNVTAYTHTPHTYYAFIRQQLRWRRGFIKESTFAMTFLWQSKPILFLETLIWEIIMPFISLSLMLIVILHFIWNPIFFLSTIIPALIFLSAIKNLPYLLHDFKKLPQLIHFTLFTNFILYWLGIYALFTLKTRSWITR